MIAAHFHLSTDGAGVLNLAEWATLQAHRDAAGQPAPRLRAATRDFPGVSILGWPGRRNDWTARYCQKATPADSDYVPLLIGVRRASMGVSRGTGVIVA
jgi:hypothetical protein